MAQLTRTVKYRTYRAKIKQMVDSHLPSGLEEAISAPQEANKPDVNGISRSTTSLNVSEIIRATQEIGGQPIVDMEMVEKKIKRRFILKVVLSCLAAVALLLILYIIVV
ncbi:MAG TPA: hypothetical protein DCM23_00920 [Firmicutes bacterium]|nr:hypothetical protein [Bacillota bacterium]HAV20158.1 hypothetical protein [Bacillota bacterium]